MQLAWWRTNAKIQTHTRNIQYLLFFHGKNSLQTCINLILYVHCLSCSASIILSYSFSRGTSVRFTKSVFKTFHVFQRMEIYNTGIGNIYCFPLSSAHNYFNLLVLTYHFCVSSPSNARGIQLSSHKVKLHYSKIRECKYTLIMPLLNVPYQISIFKRLSSGTVIRFNMSQQYYNMRSRPINFGAKVNHSIPYCY
jgi:hypothetical protein